MAELINVGVETEAQGPHLEAYLSSLAAADGVELVALVDPSEKSIHPVQPGPTAPTPPVGPMAPEFSTSLV